MGHRGSQGPRRPSPAAGQGSAARPPARAGVAVPEDDRLVPQALGPPGGEGPRRRARHPGPPTTDTTADTATNPTSDPTRLTAVTRRRKTGGIPQKLQATSRRRFAAGALPALQRAAQPVNPALRSGEGLVPGLRHVRTRRRAARPHDVRPIEGPQVRMRGRMARAEGSPGSVPRLLRLPDVPEHPASLKPHGYLRGAETLLCVRDHEYQCSTHREVQRSPKKLQRYFPRAARKGMTLSGNTSGRGAGGT